MNLDLLLKKVNTSYTVYSNNSSNNPTLITLNSKECTHNTIFVAVKGYKVDGHSFISDAFNNGCRNFIITDSKSIFPEVASESSIVIVTDARAVLGDISRVLNEYPDKKLKITGITGTKGKTTVTTLIYHFYSHFQQSSYFTTIRYKAGNETGDSERTTMESYKLQALLKKSLTAGDKLTALEVSSHALTLHRVKSVEWDSAVYTNFSRDHLDLYETMDNYFDAKLDLFRALSNSPKLNKFAVIYADDPKSKDIAKVLNDSVKICTVSQNNSEANFYIQNITTTNNGMDILFTIKGKGEFKAHTNLKGVFNGTNLILAMATAYQSGMDIEDILSLTSNCPLVEGRFEVIVNNDPYTVIVDYAHSPDSLTKILIECRKICTGKLYILFGCTGDRDMEKRPIMGTIAGELSDFVVITDDDMYSENPSVIRKMVIEGLLNLGKKENIDFVEIEDRKQAIHFILKKASKNDVVVLAGMGHEKVQITANGPIPYNDKATVLEYQSNKS